MEHLLHATRSLVRDFEIHASSIEQIIETDYGLDIGVLRFDSRRGLEIILFTAAFRTVLGPTQPPTQWVSGAISLGVKRPGREADHSPPSSAEIKE
jgi:hypothetical protein